MADQRITQLGEITTVTPDDYFVVVDNATSATKKVQAGNALSDAVVTTAKLVDAAVTPAKWRNPYRFSVYRGINYSSANSTASIIAFNTKLYDTNSNFDVATNVGRYTAPVSGTYHFDARTGTSGANGSNTRIYMSIYVNGVEIKRGLDTTVGSGSFMSATISGDIQMTAGQYAEIYLYTTNISGMQGNAIETYFNGFLVSQT